MCVCARISLILYSDRTASSVPSIHCVMAQSRDRKAPEESRLLAALRPRLVRTPARRHASWSGKLGLPCVETEATRSGTMLSISLCGRLFLMVICRTEALTMVPERCFRSDSFCPKSSLVVCSLGPSSYMSEKALLCSVCLFFYLAMWHEWSGHCPLLLFRRLQTHQVGGSNETLLCYLCTRRSLSSISLVSPSRIRQRSKSRFFASTR